MTIVYNQTVTNYIRKSRLFCNILIIRKLPSSMTENVMLFWGEVWCSSISKHSILWIEFPLEVLYLRSGNKAKCQKEKGTECLNTIFLFFVSSFVTSFFVSCKYFTIICRIYMFSYYKWLFNVTINATGCEFKFIFSLWHLGKKPGVEFRHSNAIPRKFRQKVGKVFGSFCLPY